MSHLSETLLEFRTVTMFTIFVSKEFVGAFQQEIQLLKV